MEKLYKNVNGVRVELTPKEVEEYNLRQIEAAKLAAEEETKSAI